MMMCSLTADRGRYDGVRALQFWHSWLILVDGQRKNESFGHNHNMPAQLTCPSSTCCIIIILLIIRPADMPDMYIRDICISGRR